MQNVSETTRSSPAAADLIVRGKRVITPEGERAAAIHVRGGVISAVSGFDEIVQGATVHEAGDLVVMPGLVDTHVHINEPGRTDWEGFSTATRAALAVGAGLIGPRSCAPRRPSQTPLSNTASSGVGMAGKTQNQSGRIRRPSSVKAKPGACTTSQQCPSGSEK